MFDLSGDSETPYYVFALSEDTENSVVGRVTYGCPIECKD